MLLVPLTGCILEIDDPYYYDRELADLEVAWSIDHSDSPSMCARFDIDHWVVELQGPEDRQVVIDCRSDYWTTANDLLSVYEGYYSVEVLAVDTWGNTRAMAYTSFDLRPFEPLKVLNLSFSSSDF